jgi:hypothetical protein
MVVPYLSGEDLMSTPRTEPTRRIVDCGEVDLDALTAQYPQTVELLRAKVNPAADAANWHRFSAPAKTLRTWLRGHNGDSYICTAENSSWHVMVAVSATYLPSNKIVVFTTDSPAALCVLQSQPHEIWRRQFSSTLKNDLSYVASDCFDTFPQPIAEPRLQAAGVALMNGRSSVMRQLGVGATTLYNSFHNPDDQGAAIVGLRELHRAMDRAVLDAYGWTDLPSDCEFILDHEANDDDSSRKAAWRYRWPDGVHDEVLGRLLALNAERAAEEQRSGAAAAPKGGKAKAKVAAVQVEGLF